VRVDVSIPGHELIAQRVQHEDVHLALDHAFQDMERQLKAVVPHINHAEYAVTVNGQLMMPQEMLQPH
jgi:ribosome-associated translation inhibitor RaiA